MTWTRIGLMLAFVASSVMTFLLSFLMLIAAFNAIGLDENLIQDGRDYVFLMIALVVTVRFWIGWFALLGRLR